MLATDHFVVHSPGSPPEPVSPKDGDVLTTEEIIQFVRKYWRLWVLYLLVSLGIGAALAASLPRYYTSYATLLLSGPAAAQTGGPDTADTRGYIASQIQVIQSDEVVGRAVDQTRLMEDTEFGWLDEGMRSKVTSYVRRQLAFLLGGEELAGETTNIRYQTMLRVKRSLSVTQRGFSNAVEIGFTSKNPQLSARLANAIARSYIENQREQRQMVRAAEASELQSRLAELREKAFATHALNGSLSDDPESAEEARLRFRELQSTTEVYRSLYNDLLQRPYTGTDVGSLIHSARVITAAEPPLRQTWPPIILVVALAAIVGNIGALGHALISQATDRSLRTVEDVRRSVSVDCVTGVCRIPRRRWKVLTPREQCLQDVYSKDSAELHSILSRIAVRLHEARNRHGGIVIGVISPVAGSGTSTIAAHLARVIRETGQKTLLVDANWRKQLAGQPILYVEPARNLAGAVTTIPADQEGLEVLILRPTGPISELNASLSILTMLRRLQQECDWVVVDFHSIEQTADLEAAMNVISEVLIVLQARRTSWDHIDGMLRIVPREKIAAAVLNRL